jgi:acyl-CoA synthetase (NDP forming)
VAVLPGELQRTLRQVLPPPASVGNPVETGAVVSTGAFGSALTTLLDAPEVDAVMTVTAPTAVGDPAPGVVQGVAAAAERCGPVPVIDVRLGAPEAVWRTDLPGDPGRRFLVSVADPVVAARALAVGCRHRAHLTRPPGTPVVPDGVDVHAASAVVTGVLTRAPAGDWLRPDEVTALCTAAGLPLVPTRHVRTAREAAAAARALGTPVAVKGSVAGIVHKADAGLLRLPVSRPAEVHDAVASWIEASGEDWLGAVVQPVVPPGEEFLVGAVRDPSAGPVAALGPGGRSVDALGHRVHRLAPLTDLAVEEALDGTGLFATAHGRTLDRSAVADCLVRVAWLADALPDVAEVEVDPFVVTGPRGAALDVRVRVQPAG